MTNDQLIELLEGLQGNGLGDRFDDGYDACKRDVLLLLRPCQHEWRNVIDVCKDRPCTGSVLGRKCIRCGLFDGTTPPERTTADRD